MALKKLLPKVIAVSLQMAAVSKAQETRSVVFSLIHFTTDTIIKDAVRWYGRRAS